MDGLIELMGRIMSCGASGNSGKRWQRRTEAASGYLSKPWPRTLELAIAEGISNQHGVYSTADISTWHRS